jgi:hypothetical protein
VDLLAGRHASRPLERTSVHDTQLEDEEEEKDYVFKFDGGRQKGEKWGAVNTKKLFPGICLLLLIVSEVFWFSANRQKSLAQEQLREAQQQVADLQSQLDELTNSGAANEAVETTRLRAENQDIPRLRSQIQQLQSDNSKLLRELSAAREADGKRNEQLQEMETQNEQAQADEEAQAEAQQQAIQQTIAQERNACIANLRLIYAAKQAWALDKSKTDSDVPTEQDLLPYLKGGVFPVCPTGGTYTIGAVGVLPTCSIPGHVMPPQ